jgi:hypothetical protein
VRAVPDVVTARHGLQMRATASSGNTERPIESGLCRLSFDGRAGEM